MRVSFFLRPLSKTHLRVVLISLGFLLLPFSKAQEEPPFDSPNPLSGSPFAPERPLRFDFPQDVEALLKGIEEASGPVDKFSLKITWKLTSSEPYDWSRDGVGPRSFKCSLNWIPPAEGGELPSEGELLLGGKGGDFHIFCRNENGEITQWWHKKGSYLYSSRMQELLPFVTRYPC